MTGTPATLELQSSTPVEASINSKLRMISVAARDQDGKLLSNVPITFAASASGPGATFHVIGSGISEYPPTPNPLQTSVSTDASCGGAKPFAIANAQTGSYTITASTPGAPPLTIPVTNFAPEATTWISGAILNSSFLHLGSSTSTRLVAYTSSAGRATVGMPVSFSVPAGGASALFAGNATTAVAYTDAQGIAYSPPLTANSQVGAFSGQASAGALAPVSIGPLINAGPTAITLERLQPKTPSSVFGDGVSLVAKVSFPGFPRAGYLGGPYGYPKMIGTILIKADGATIATLDIASYISYSLLTCADCAGFEIWWYFGKTDLSFGVHQLSAEYVGQIYDSSSSAAVQHLVTPAFTGPTVSGGNSAAGVMPTLSQPWHCTLSQAAWQTLSSNQETAGYQFPYGLFRYRIDGCTPQFPIGVPPGGLHAIQTLVIKLPSPLPNATQFLNYGPTADNNTPHWYALPTEIEGDTLRVTLHDGGAGDDDLQINDVIAGLGGPAVVLPADVPATSIPLLAMLVLAMLMAAIVQAKDRAVDATY